MAKVQRVERVKSYLKAETKRGVKKNVKVSYSARYGIFVHEWKKGQKVEIKSEAQRRAMFASIREREARGHVSWEVGQPKFLEQPARQYQDEMAAIVQKNLKNKESLETALLRAGRFLLAKSQEMVPVDTGNLKASGAVTVVGS